MRTILIILAAAGAIALFGLFGYAIASDGEQPGTPVPKNSGIHIDISDDHGLHVREVQINGERCFIATTMDGVSIDCLDRDVP